MNIGAECVAIKRGALTLTRVHAIDRARINDGGVTVYRYDFSTGFLLAGRKVGREQTSLLLHDDVCLREK